ncbi:terminase gpA endonuclease subunit [Escherichia coli]|nr:phage terminase large subunit family protein [Escherichia coli]
MNISNSQVNRLRHFVRAGLRSLFRPEPQTAVEWADANYYLPKESAYQEGRWETLPFQRAIMNAMGSDYIREVNVVKSARVGYSKMLLGVYAYFIEHTAKEQIYNRFTLTPEGDEPLPGAVHFPNNPDIFDLTEAQQLTAEEQVEKWVDGRKKILWDSKKRRNEALDCFVYALAALRISISRWQLDLSALLASLQEEDGAATNKKTLADYARALSGEDE